MFLISVISLFLFLKPPNKSLQPNVLLITIDCLRFDHLSCYGYKRHTSPNIDNLAKEGAMFTQAIVQSYWTLPSVSSIITSTYPPVHRVLDFGDSINPKILTLSEILKKEGYRTGVICPDFFTTIGRLGRGFDLFDANLENEDAARLTQKAMNWFKRNKHKPFFLWLHYFDAHTPYRAADPYNKMFLKDGFYDKKIENLPVDPNVSIRAIPKRIIKDNITDGNYYISQYDGAIRSVDAQIGVLLGALKSLSMDSNTLIIITADHGELLGESGIFFDHVGFFEEVLRVPLLMRFNNLIPKHKVIGCQVQAIDIVPTILEILKVDKLSFMQGFSLLPVILGRGNYCPPYTFFYAIESICGIRTSEWKLIYVDWEKAGVFAKRMTGWGLLNEEAAHSLIEYFRSNLHKEKNKLPSAEYILYDLKQNPSEPIKSINLEKERFIILKEKLEEFMRLGNQALSKAKVRINLDEETKERLKSLGYVQ